MFPHVRTLCSFHVCYISEGVLMNERPGSGGEAGGHSLTEVRRTAIYIHYVVYMPLC